MLELLKDRSSSDEELRKILKELQYDELDLPPGCEVTYDLEAIEIMKSLLRPTGKDAALLSFYADFLELEGERPTALEAYQGGINPRAARAGYGSWFGLVQSKGGLSEAEEQTWRSNQAWFEHLEKTTTVKSYKMVVLLAMMSAGRFPGTLTGEELTRAFRKVAERSARLRKDVEAHLDSDHKLLKMLERNPIDAWCGGKGTGGIAYFKYEDGVFQSVGFRGDHSVVEKLTRESVEWRVADYLDRNAHQEVSDGSFLVKVS